MSFLVSQIERAADLLAAIDGEQWRDLQAGTHLATEGPGFEVRLNSLFAGGTEGAHRAAVLLGIIATCRRESVEPLAYLTWVFERVGTDRGRYGMTAAELTPRAYAREHPP